MLAPAPAAGRRDRVRITNAKIATDRDGLKRVEVSGVCDVEVLESPDADQSALDDGTAAAATDGGDDADQLKKRVKDALRNDYGPGSEVTVSNLAGGLRENPSSVEEVLDDLATETSILTETENGYRRLN